MTFARGMRSDIVQVTQVLVSGAVINILFKLLGSVGDIVMRSRRKSPKKDINDDATIITSSASGVAVSWLSKRSASR